jgi:hypothetical protein
MDIQIDLKVFIIDIFSAINIIDFQLIIELVIQELQHQIFVVQIENFLNNVKIEHQVFVVQI